MELLHAHQSLELGPPVMQITARSSEKAPAREPALVPAEPCCVLL